MIVEHQQEKASLYALGVLEGEERHAFETELRQNPELRILVFELQKASRLMALSVPQASLPPGLKDKVLRRVESAASPHSAPHVGALAGLQFLTAPALSDWKQLPIPGTYIKLLSFEKDRGYAVLLGKLDPGVRYPAHVNAGPEDFYILTGDLVVGSRKLVAGDFHHADPGSHHEVNYSEEGCTLLAVLTIDDPLVAFAMS
jgi:anti-sigma factor ChrR (cupin superfamily)